ncbi:MAG: thioredoxin-dependent thiol peroxidase [Acidobacteria bacterium]|nr:MAG: peroxiredoxin [Acidobacteria bacterium 13_1_40CM_2_68_10]PYT36761.1 MAG: thioredoxin-dependent thiol peroxidase [Acidobacteriota bacterium]
METDAIPQIGSRAPDFTLVGTGGKTVGLRDFLGKKHLVLYFYPKDATPGCSMEACGFRDAYPHFEEHGTVILGVSRDGVDSHDKFSSRHRLPFLLLSDPGAEVCNAYGVFGTKSFLGREFLGIHRTTFVIDSRGTIRGVFPKVKVREHAQEVLRFIQRELD